jgi:hypothetical protein
LTTIGHAEQLAQWVKGKPIHGAECCPDFSCCDPELLQPERVRLAYAFGSQQVRAQMCAQFLAAMLKRRGLGHVRVIGPE